MKRDVLVIAHQHLPFDPRVKKGIEALNDAGARVDVLCLRAPGQSFRDSMGPARLYRLPVRRHRGAALPVYLAEYAAFFILASIAATFLQLTRRYKVVVTHTLPDPLVFAAALPRLFGARVVMDMHEFTPELYQTRYPNRDHPLIRALLVLERWSCRFADTVVTVHDPGVELLSRTGVPPERIVVVMNSADESAVEARASRNDGPFTLVYHGTLVNTYDLESVLEAIARLVAAGDRRVRLRLIGEGPVRDGLAARAEALGIADRVSFEDPIPLARIPAVLAQCDAGVVPFHDIPYAQVALPMKGLECMAAGLPVITNRTGVLAYYFDADAVCWVPFADVDALASAIARLRDDTGYRKKLVEHARRQVRPIRWQIMAERFVRACGFDPKQVSTERPRVRSA